LQREIFYRSSSFLLRPNMPFPDIDPILFSIGPFSVRWYALAYIVGLLGGWFYARSLCADEKQWGATMRPTALHIDDLILWVALGVVLGGRAGYVLFYNLPFYLDNPVEIFKVWAGGMSFHGGLGGATLAIVLFARKHKLNSLALLDVVSVVVPLGLLLGRIANFINSELWGRIAPDFAYAVIFPNGGAVPRHPSQLYEAATEGLVLLIVMAFLARRFGFTRPGLLTGFFGVGYALARIGCEFFREPDPQLGFILGTNVLTMGMVLCLPMALLGVYLILRSTKVAKPEGNSHE
jgi:phosphatidylglycerol---prolipoprotein diacylglyceryl transferase